MDRLLLTFKNNEIQADCQRIVMFLLLVCNKMLRCISALRRGPRNVANTRVLLKKKLKMSVLNYTKLIVITIFILC